MIAAVDLCFADHEQHITTAGQDLDNIDRDLSMCPTCDLDRDLSTCPTCDIDDTDRDLSMCTACDISIYLSWAYRQCQLMMSMGALNQTR